MSYVEYSSNNSGGGWWLKDEHWKALEAAGWVVAWRPDRFLGALATEAHKPDCSDLRSAVQEWERITGMASTDAGCACCGQPHWFTLYDDSGKRLESGPEAKYTASW